MYCVWRAYLEGTVQATQTRIGACENYKVHVADPAKTMRLQKDQQLRKVHRERLMLVVMITIGGWKRDAKILIVLYIKTSCMFSAYSACNPPVMVDYIL